MARPKSVLDAQEMAELRMCLESGLSQYHAHPGELKDHHHVELGRIPCVNESDRTMECPCSGLTRLQVTRMVEKIRTRPVTPEYAYGVLCMLSASKSAERWRTERDPGEDEWLWRMRRSYLDGARYAAPEPRELEPLEAAIAIAPEQEWRLARDIATLLCRDRSFVPKKHASEVERVIKAMLKKKRAEYNYAFATWLLNTNDVYTVVVDETKFDVTRIVTRTGPQSTQAHEIVIPRTAYEVHYRHSARKGTREPHSWEIVYVLNDRNLLEEANQRLRERHRGR